MITNNMIAETPEEAKTDLQIVNLIADFYRDSDEYHTAFFENMREYYGFYDGSRQWFQKNAQGEWIDVKKQIEQQGKYALTNNMVFPLINLVQGIQNDSRLTTVVA